MGRLRYADGDFVLSGAHLAAGFKKSGIANLGRVESEDALPVSIVAGRCRTFATLFDVRRILDVTPPRDYEIERIGLELTLERELPPGSWVEIAVHIETKSDRSVLADTLPIHTLAPGVATGTWLTVHPKVAASDLKSMLVMLASRCAKPFSVSFHGLGLARATDAPESASTVSLLPPEATWSIKQGAGTLRATDREDRDPGCMEILAKGKGGFEDDLILVDVSERVRYPTPVNTLELDLRVIDFDGGEGEWCELVPIWQGEGDEWERLGPQLSLHRFVRNQWRHVAFTLPGAPPVDNKTFDRMWRVRVASNAASPWSAHLLVRSVRLARRGGYRVGPLSIPEQLHEALFAAENYENPDRVVATSLQLRRIYDLVHHLQPRATLEVGLGVGGSACHIIAASGRPHVSMDDRQKAVYGGKGLENLRRFGLRDLLEFHPQPSQAVLPRLVASGRSFDFIYLDGDHRFAGVFTDFYFSDLLLEPLGYLLLDDTQIGGVEKLASFLRTNESHRYAYLGEPYPCSALFQKVSMYNLLAHNHFAEF